MSMSMEEQVFASSISLGALRDGLAPSDTVPPWRRARSTGLRARLREWARSLDFTLARRFGLANREDRLFFLLIGAVGVVGGAAGRRHRPPDRPGPDPPLGLAGGPARRSSAKVHRWVVVAAPAVGGALVGLILWLAAGGSRGRGEAAARGWRC